MQANRQTDKCMPTDRQTEMQANRQTNRDAGQQTGRQMQANKQADRCRPTNRQTDAGQQTGRQMQANKQADRCRPRDRQTWWWTLSEGKGIYYVIIIALIIITFINNIMPDIFIYTYQYIQTESIITEGRNMYTRSVLLRTHQILHKQINRIIKDFNKSSVSTMHPSFYHMANVYSYQN